MSSIKTDEHVNKIILNNMSDLRHAEGLSQTEVAIKIGVSLKTLHKWERSYTFPSVPEILQLSKIYGCKFEDLFFYETI